MHKQLEADRGKSYNVFDKKLVEKEPGMSDIREREKGEQHELYLFQMWSRGSDHNKKSKVRMRRTLEIGLPAAEIRSGKSR